jgi:hypothetical protein
LNSSNAAIPNVVVSFSASGGSLSASSATTDESGIATVNFSSGLSDKTNHQVVIEATTGTFSAQIPVLIDGTTVEALSDKTSLTIGGDNADVLSIFVADASGSPIYDADVSLSLGTDSTGDVTLSASSGKTDILGLFDVTVTGASIGTATIEIAAAGAIDSYTYSIQSTGSTLAITEPIEDPASLEIGQQLTILVSDPIPGPSNQVVIATSLGSLTDGENTGPAVTVPVTNGYAQAQLLSNEAGIATVQAFDIDNSEVTDSVSVAMYATQASKISVQASSDVVATSTEALSNTVEIIANVLNTTDDVVGGAPVLFTLDNTTGGGEKISPTIVYTDESGNATATFTSGSEASGGEGVIVTASVLGASTISDSISIVIGGEAGSVVIGTSTKIESIDEDTAYRLPVSVLVSDANGNAVPESTVSLGLWPAYYYTGDAYRVNADSVYEYYGPFPNEDTNRNTFLDSGEDKNGDGQITPQNSAAGSIPTVVTTDEKGVATFDLIYLKDYASYIVVELTASTYVLGSETISTVYIKLSFEEGDEQYLPPSPFGPPLDFVPPVDEEDEEDDTVSVLHVTATPDAINPNETTTVEVVAYDASGYPVSSVDISFTLDDPSMASIIRTATTDDNGSAQVTLTARSTSGEVNVTATSGSISSEPTTVTIL